MLGEDDTDKGPGFCGTFVSLTVEFATIERAEWARQAVVIMDIQLPDGSGIEATREIRARLPKTQVLMLTTFADDDALFASKFFTCRNAARTRSGTWIAGRFWANHPGK